MTLQVADLGILADDLTGACDVAASFAPFAGPVTVHIHPNIFHPSDAVLEVYNTQTRTDDTEDYKVIIRSVGDRLVNKIVVFKKIDAALRGNVGAELEVLLQLLGPRRVILAPAIPRIGRTTKGGIQYDRGVPIDRTPYARDVLSPIFSADIAEVVASTSAVACEIADVETDEDLCAIVGRVLDGSRLILAGSLGLADALAEYVELRPRGNQSIPPASRILLVCGSAYPQAVEQVVKAAVHYGVVPLDVSTVVNTSGTWSAAGEPAILYIGQHTSVGTSTEMLAHLIDVAKDLIVRSNPNGLGVIGGDTAFQLLAELGASRLRVYGRTDEVISYGVVVDGLLTDCPFATKGGSVGASQAAIIMMEFLKNGCELT